MKCPYCKTGYQYESAAFEESAVFGDVVENGDAFSIFYGECPECNKFIVMLELQEMTNSGIGTTSQLLFPKVTNRTVEPEVPDDYRRDFIEAASIVTLSPKASAALSRRLLQHILREHFKIKHKSLAQEIDDFLKLKDVPSYLSGAVDAVRNIGNFAAHPLKDTSTGSVVDVEPGESDWLLDVLDSLFDYAFVQPKRLAEKRDALNLKLQAIGKPPMK